MRVKTDSGGGQRKICRPVREGDGEESRSLSREQE